MNKPKIKEIRRPRKVHFPFLPVPRRHLADLMSVCTVTETRCFLLIAKLTVGLVNPETNEHVQNARISMREFATYCNIGERSAQFALRTLQKRGLIKAEGPIRHPRIYSIVLAGDITENVTASPRKDINQCQVTLLAMSGS